MIILRQYSDTKTLNTDAPGFIKGRKYDMDFNRLGRLKTQRELQGTGVLAEEIRKMNKELNLGRTGKWKDTQ